MATYVGITGLNRGRTLRCPAVTGLSAPGGVGVVTVTTGGSIAASTAYYYKVTAIGSGGETVGSSEVTVTTGGSGSTHKNTVTWTNVTGAVSYRVYRGTSSGAQSVYFADSDGSPFVDTGAAGTAGTVPTSNTAYVSSGLSSLSSTAVLIVDVDDAATRKALGHHGAIGSWIVVATNARVAGSALPSNS